MKSADKLKNEYIESYHKDEQVAHYRGIFKYKSDSVIHKLEMFFTLKEIAKISNKDSCLDIACGFGRITRFIENKFKRVYGVDASSKMLSFAKKDCKKAEFKVGDAEDIPFSSDMFDFETCFRFIMNFKKPVRVKMLKEFNRVLKKDGTLILNIHRNKYGFRGIYSVLRNAILGNDEPYLSYYEAQKELKISGFKIKKVYGIKMIPYWRGMIFFPENIMVSAEKVLGRIPILKYLADGLIIVARKK